MSNVKPRPALCVRACVCVCVSSDRHTCCALNRKTNTAGFPEGSGCMSSNWEQGDSSKCERAQRSFFFLSYCFFFYGRGMNLLPTAPAWSLGMGCQASRRRRRPLGLDKHNCHRHIGLISARCCFSQPECSVQRGAGGEHFNGDCSI